MSRVPIPRSLDENRRVSTFLRTARLDLRQIGADDAEALYALNQDPEVTRYLAVPRWSIERISAELIPYYRSFSVQHPGFGYWAVIERMSGTFLGWIFLRPPLDEPVAGEVELGYRLNRVAWGRGYATEAALAVIEHGFRECDVDRVVAWTMTINSGSRRVMEKCGLRFVRKFADPDSKGVDGAEHGDVEYALTRAEWAAG